MTLVMWPWAPSCDEAEAMSKDVLQRVNTVSRSTVNRLGAMTHKALLVPRSWKYPTEQFLIDAHVNGKTIYWCGFVLIIGSRSGLIKVFTKCPRQSWDCARGGALVKVHRLDHGGSSSWCFQKLFLSV
eukprot:Skav224807  [mRNA]  locus=scaffold764:703143:703526:- [translate_table: standard]